MTGYLFSNHCLWTNIECAYCADIMLILFGCMFFYLMIGSLRFVLSMNFFLSRVSTTNLSLQYVNPKSDSKSWCRPSSGGWLYRWPMTHNMSSLSLALQWHLWVLHVHDNSHVNIVFSWGSPMYVPAFITS